jgi:hypothetical protein
MRNRKVEGWSFNSAAAPLGPLIRHPVASRARKIFFRSASSAVKMGLNRSGASIYPADAAVAWARDSGSRRTPPDTTKRKEMCNERRPGKVCFCLVRKLMIQGFPRNTTSCILDERP